MGERPPSVRIEDLAEPQFPSEITEMMDAVAPMAAELSFSPDAVLGAACGETGLDDFGDDWFREPIALVLRCLDEEAGLSPFGRISAHSMMVGHLRNRLRAEHLVRAHPEVLDVAIERPIFIVGQPRTGTTHLHNLMAADPALRSLPYWESLEPVPSDEEQAAVADGALDPRRDRCAVGLEFLDAAMPLFERMHEMTVDHVHEEIQLLAMGGSTMLFETMAPMPTWRDWYRSHDQLPAYEYLKKALQCCQWLRGGERWVLKSPQHMEQIPALLQVFPDATFVFTHRDPVSVITSMTTMITYTARTSAAKIDPVMLGEYWADRVETMLRAGMRDHHLLPEDRSIDVRFDEFMADDLAMVRRIYDVADQPFTDEASAAMEAFMVEHPRGVHGGIVYDLTGDFGLDPTELRDRFRDYTDTYL